MLLVGNVSGWRVFAEWVLVVIVMHDSNKLRRKFGFVGSLVVARGGSHDKSCIEVTIR